jgi:hypothetical protein
LLAQPNSLPPLLAEAAPSSLTSGPFRATGAQLLLPRLILARSLLGRAQQADWRPWLSLLATMPLTHWPPRVSDSLPIPSSTFVTFQKWEPSFPPPLKSNRAQSCTLPSIAHHGGYLSRGRTSLLLILTLVAATAASP